MAPLSSEEGFLAIRDEPILPICYAALAQRSWKQIQSRSEAVSSFHPSERFGSLIIALAEYRQDVLRADVLKSWEIVNDVAKKLFGRTVVEEMDLDIKFENEFIDKIKSESSERIGLQPYEDYHALRSKLFREFVNNPRIILDQREYASKTDRRVKPYVIVAASGGEIGDPPPDYSRVMGYRDPALGELRPDAKWWWAASLKDLPLKSDADICFTTFDRWMEVVSDLAPAAKLVMDGRNLRTMLGPEILGAEARLRSILGIKIVVDPRHAYPTNQIASDFWYYITGRNTHRCDLTYEPVEKPEGIVVDPWAMRLRPGLFDQLLGSDYADKTELSFSFWRDWSPWFFSEEFRARLEQYPEDYTSIANPFANTVSASSGGA